MHLNRAGGSVFKHRLLSIVFACLPLAALAGDLPSYPFIHATGTAYSFVTPDLGEIDFDVSVFDPVPDVATAQVAARIGEIKALLVEQGLPDAAAGIEVRDVRKEIRKGAEQDPANPQYQIKASVHINVADLSKWPAIMRPLLAMPNLDAFAVTFGATERIRLEEELMGEAVKDAQRKADAMARGFGKRAGAVAGISSDQLKNLGNAVGLVPSDRYNRANSRQRQNPEDMLMVTSLKMAQTVDAVFRIK
ncbi:SIMPL domain-containing protein [Janthinobacterium lividum]|nr:SIMPL domain-containing protein [Janthinobacterium lividum]